MEKILVTGAGGYIGSVLIPKLLNKGYKVRALDRFFFGKEKLKENKNLEIIQEDSRKIDEENLRGIDYVIDLVAISNDPSGELFKKSTYEINHKSRVSTAKISKKCGIKRYILPSSCSIYGFQDFKVNEDNKTNPLTTYAKANEMAEKEILNLGDEKFCVTVMRQATIFGYSPRMRFDLAINSMVFGAWKYHKLPLMRNGDQYRPMLHVQDTTDVMLLLLEVKSEKINREIFNVGSDKNNYQIKTLGNIVSTSIERITKKTVEVEWYGDPDYRSYKVDFSKIENKLNWKAKWDAEMGVNEIIEKLENGEIDKRTQTITLEWYQNLIKWHKKIKEIEMYGGIIDL